MTEPARLDDVARAPLAGRRALVTGGSRGIGAGIARRLAADGAAVAFTYREAKGPAHSLEQEITGSGGQALAVRADSEDPEPQAARSAGVRAARATAARALPMCMPGRWVVDERDALGPQEADHRCRPGRDR
jgi:NAD(P)-dependent dehydrogenase (short-subunit alcohol dehydrogenase family)